MASVKSVSFTCPECAKVLRASARPPEGRKIKCPACAHFFVPELDSEDDSATRIQAKPNAKAKRVGSRDDDDEEPRNQKSHADDDDEAPRKKKKRNDDEVDDDDDDRSIKKKGSKKKSGKGMLIIGGVVLLGGGALLSCVLCGVGAFVWPGFLKSNNPAELNAFIGPDANMVMGGNPKQLKAKIANLERIIKDQGAFVGQGNAKELEDVALNSERMLAFSHTSDAERKMVTVFQSTAADIQKVKRNPNLGAAQTVGGHNNVHKQGAQAKQNGLPKFLAFPGNNIVVTTDGDEAALIAALDRAKKPAQANATLEMGKSVSTSPFWMAVTPDADSLNKMRQEFERGGAMMPPGLRNAAPAVSGIKGVTLAMDTDDKSDFKLNANVMCKDAADATRLRAGVDDAWTMFKGVFMLGAMMQQPGQPPIPPTFTQDINSITFGTQGANMTASMKLQSKTIEELARIGAQKNVGPGPGPMFPPPKIDPFPNPKIDPFPPPKKNPFPKVGKGKLTNNFTQVNLQPGDMRDKVFQFQQGKIVTVVMTSVTVGNADVDVHVFRGNAGGNLVGGDSSIGPNGNVAFIVPATDFYRIQITNLGPGVATSSIVQIFEQ